MKHPVKHALARRTVLAGAAAASAAMVWGTAGRAVAHGRTGPVAQGSVDAEVARLERGLVALRRDIHQHPELPGQERRTAGVVARELRVAGLEVTTGVGGNGVVGVLRGSRPGRTVAYRADMDAVPPQDIVGGGPAAARLRARHPHHRGGRRRAGPGAAAPATGRNGGVFSSSPPRRACPGRER